MISGRSKQVLQNQSGCQFFTNTCPLLFSVFFKPELGTWAEESTAWEEDGVSEIDIELQTEKLKKERKQAERERRAMEQQKKREEREAHKIQKPQGHFGVRIAT